MIIHLMILLVNSICFMNLSDLEEPLKSNTVVV